jgi:hypothetical protein
MQSAMNNTDKQSNDPKWNGKTEMSSGTSGSKSISSLGDIRNLSSEDIRGMATDFTHRARDFSSDLMRDPTGFVKRNPVGSALGLAAVGFLAGMLFRRRY